MKFTYTGWFVEQSINNKFKLNKRIEFPHLTLAFKPQQGYEQYFGSKALIQIVGYGNDGENEGYLCKVVPKNPFLREKASKIEIPHITLSVSSSGKPVNTKNLNFQPIEPFLIIGTYGGFKNGKVFLSPIDN